jgi:predicted transcriptional regulator
LLSRSPRSLSDLAAATTVKESNLIPKIRILEIKGLIEKNGHGYAITSSGRILLPRIIDLILSYETAARTGDAGGNVSPIADRGAGCDAHEGLLVLCRSPINVKILLDCSRCPRTRDRLRRITGSGSPALTPRIRWLVQRNLLEECHYTYQLTPAGRIVTTALESLIGTVAVVARHRCFWNAHLLERLPDFACNTMSDLIDAEIIHDDPVHYFVNYELFLGILKNAKWIHAMSGMVSPSIADVLGARVAAGVPAEVIVTPDLARELYREPYLEKVEFFSSFNNLHLFVTDLPVPMGITTTDACISAKLLLLDGVTYDMQNGVYCASPESRAWGERLFQYYRHHSVPLQIFFGDVQEGTPGTST